MPLFRSPGSHGAVTRGARHGRAPVSERIAFWSARHAKTAVAGWFGLVGAAFLAGQMLGTQSLPQFDPGQAGQGERALHQLNVTTPPAESVLIQPRAPDADQLSFANDAQMRQAVRQVTAALDRLHATAMDVIAPSLGMSRRRRRRVRQPLGARQPGARSALLPPAPSAGTAASFRPAGTARW